MPDFYTHRIFGGMVYDALGAGEKTLTDKAKEGWKAGLYGPDPLFFCRKSAAVRREGHTLHHVSPDGVLMRLFAARDMEEVPGYAAGMLCHYMLDALCHPVVNAAAQGSSKRHTLIEYSLDIALMRSYKGRYLDDLMPHGNAVFEAMSEAYDQADAGLCKDAMNGFIAVSKASAATRGLRLSFCDEKLITELTQKAGNSAAECACAVTKLLNDLKTGEFTGTGFETDYLGVKLK